ncbi:hypothetical protein ACFZAM_31885 [Streptomyces sp. NPDC008079]|uniref:hypothetical protein n=1 Tax=Streptomyces sp. NPDC008079 TaxID=3364806 RepID=UPI0036E74369
MSVTTDSTGQEITDAPPLPEQEVQSCRSEEGKTVGLVDAIIGIMRFLCERDMTPAPVQDALSDLFQDKDFKAVQDAWQGGHPAPGTPLTTEQARAYDASAYFEAPEVHADGTYAPPALVNAGIAVALYLTPEGFVRVSASTDTGDVPEELERTDSTVPMEITVNGDTVARL